MRTFLRILGVTIVAATMMSGSAATADQSDLRILFVGPNPADVRASVSEILFMYDKAEESYKDHTPAFKSLLEAHFKDVTVVYGEDFTPDMVGGHDVVIFDAMPPQSGHVDQPYTDGNGVTMNYEAPTFLPDGYDTPTIFIGYVGPRMSGPIGTKLDWL